MLKRRTLPHSQCSTNASSPPSCKSDRQPDLSRTLRQSKNDNTSQHHITQFLAQISFSSMEHSRPRVDRRASRGFPRHCADTWSASDHHHRAQGQMVAGGASRQCRSRRNITHEPGEILAKESAHTANSDASMVTLESEQAFLGVDPNSLLAARYCVGTWPFT